jgi:hypothetical protein
MISRDEYDRLMALFRVALSTRSELSRLLAMGVADPRAEERAMTPAETEAAALYVLARGLMAALRGRPASVSLFASPDVVEAVGVLAGQPVRRHASRMGSEREFLTVVSTSVGDGEAYVCVQGSRPATPEELREARIYEPPRRITPDEARQVQEGER